jgi:LysR family glycine cleavage system transcriptional activator
MSRIPWQTLPAFRAAARSGNLRAAAEALHLTAGAVSQQIRLLESQLGVDLFDRHGRRMTLNAAGAAFLRAVEPALDRVTEGARAAQAAASGRAQTLRITMLSSFAQRWLLPRMGRWRELHPDVPIELHTSQQVVDLVREGFHAAIRQGTGPWRGLAAERLAASPLIAVGSPAAARRLAGKGTASLASEPLLGDRSVWERWFALDCCQPVLQPVAIFNDAGLMLQAAEQDIGITLGRALYVADALRAGTLVRLSPLALTDDLAYSFWLVNPPDLAGWPPLEAFRAWLHGEMRQAEDTLAAASAPPVQPDNGSLRPPVRPSEKAAARSTGNRSRARSGG